MKKVLFFIATLMLSLSINAKQVFTVTAPENHYLLPALTTELSRLNDSGRIDAIIEHFIQQGVYINL